MSFSENLKLIRKERHISQEELGEIMGVSRQAVSKWEQGIGYPEMEKLLLLSKELNVSLDYLMLGEVNLAEKQKTSVNNIIVPTGKITIKSYDGKTIVNCYKVLASQVMYKPKNDEPKYWLIGINSGAFWGEKSVVLGWYVNEEEIKKEMDEIAEAISNGLSAYELKYAVKVKNKMLRVKIDSE
ncbi:helix-turn-helix transcriptional regulator [Clostridium sporogenes]|uniref:helix-turn-helix domain-containing protein n=1 Tax=Clostridium sporogenes TaxID=1509 RepID=UPI0013D0BA99|nr:helix-turn-helix transcriptional regulator [Clostridium sporogenes]NFF67667.1 helix-turn-helix transcriptional regulator [Clostridium sporogenes]NFF98403.1 helix-turn-helix transcriptional regulator [Clostridium sporogenes]NFG05481.1 helix-turn-helix transcriptional regulator [Clostridium sporogenes]NFG50847.1 helix-turn-helix transcriptional regulator [Clostridium sporogenes]NFM15907.1 helix-turn-helix transcriptional regulator [Clostridium sporogenes]